MHMNRYRMLAHGPFLRAWMALLVSRIGSNAGFIALLWLAAERGGGTPAVGIISTAFALPAVFSGAYAGMLLDRIPKTLAIALDNGGRAVLYGLVVVVATRPVFSVLDAAVLVGVGSLLSPLSQAGILSLVPDLVQPEDLGAANGAVTAQWQLAMLAGPALGGVLTARFGPILPLELQAACYLAAALLIAPIGVPKSPSGHTLSPWAGVHLLLRSPGIRVIAIFSLLYGLAYAPLEVVLPRFIAHDLHQTAAAYGTLWAVFAIGALAGSAASGGIRHLPRLGLALATNFLLWGIVQALLGEAAGLGAALVLVGLGGLVYGPYETWTNTFLQQTTPRAALGRLLGTYMAVTGVGFPLGALLASALAPVTGSRLLLVLSGLANVAVAGMAVAVPAMRNLPGLNLGAQSGARPPSPDAS